jgi:hypothetical protein
MRSLLCSRCGSTQWEQLSETQSRCAECGLASTSTALTVTRRQPRSPEEAKRRRDAVRRTVADEGRRALAAATFTPFGLDDRWTGGRWVGGSSTSNGRLSALVLGHGDAPRDRTAMQLRVETRPADSRTSHEALWELARSQVQHFWHETGVLPDDVRRAVFPMDSSDIGPSDPWEPATLLVDGAFVEFRVLAHENDWVAQAAVDDAVVGIHARAWSLTDTGLVSIEDTSEYSEGRGLI